MGVDPLQAGNVVQLVMVLGLTVGWIATYIFRVSNKDMTYVQQLRDYENKVMEVCIHYINLINGNRGLLSNLLLFISEMGLFGFYWTRFVHIFFSSNRVLDVLQIAHSSNILVHSFVFSSPMCISGGMLIYFRIKWNTAFLPPLPQINTGRKTYYLFFFFFDK